MSGINDPEHIVVIWNDHRMCFWPMVQVFDADQLLAAQDWATEKMQEGASAATVYVGAKVGIHHTTVGADRKEKHIAVLRRT